MAKLKRVCLIANNCFNLYNFRIELIKKFIEDGFEVYTIANNDKYSKHLISIGCKHFPIKYDTYTYSIYSNLKTLFVLYKYIKYISPKIVFTFTIKPNIYLCIISFLTFKKFKLIPTVTGLGTTYIKNNLKNFIVRIIFSYLLKKSNHIFFHNKSDIKLFSKLKHKSTVIPGSGVDCNKFLYSPTEFNTRNIVYIGRFIKEKGLNELFIANNILLRKKINYNLYLVGSYDINNPNSISIDLLNNFKKTINVSIVDFIDDTKKYYNISECVILPSYREGMPRSLLEASATGRPLLASNVDGINNLIKNGYNGFLFDCYNPESIAKTIENFLYLETKEKIKIGMNARKLVERDYTIDTVISYYYKFANEYN